MRGGALSQRPLCLWRPCGPSRAERAQIAFADRISQQRRRVSPRMQSPMAGYGLETAALYDHIEVRGGSWSVPQADKVVVRQPLGMVAARRAKQRHALALAPMRADRRVAAAMAWDQHVWLTSGVPSAGGSRAQVRARARAPSAEIT